MSKPAPSQLQPGSPAGKDGVMPAHQKEGITPAPASLPGPSDFEQAALSQKEGTLLSDFWHFLNQSKKWWLVPVLLFLLLAGLLILLMGSPAAPFIYTLF